MSSGRLTGEDLRLCMMWLGPWLVGGCVDFLLQGILFTQFANYFTWYRDDKPGLRIFVGILLLITVLKSIHSRFQNAIIWIELIVWFGDLQGAMLLNYTTWWHVALCELHVQAYFCLRLWVISKKWYVVAPMATFFVFAFLVIAVAYFISAENDVGIRQWFARFVRPRFLTKKPRRLRNPLLRVQPGVAETLRGVDGVDAQRTPHHPRMHNGHNGLTTTSNEISGTRSRPRRQGDIELGAIHVVTQAETHADVRDLFDPTNDTRSDVKRDPFTKSGDDDSEQYGTNFLGENRMFRSAG
ncbi:hypothetical protein B0H13DRAFT_1876313 [Mycena leptocephala]|nr:hypothetical protein B0H13DRAFT_1876313 [Mycena leptocephala]